MADERRQHRVEGPLGRTYLEVTLAVLALVTIVAFESMAVSTAMPAVARELDAVRSYGFAFSVMLTAQLLGIVLAGVWSDRSGPMVGAVTGQALLAVGAAMCGTATNLPLFLAGRALTGLGGGLLVVMLYVIAGRVYPEAIRPRLFTYVSAAWVLPSLLGAPLSAWLTTNLSWRWVFWGVVPPVLSPWRCSPTPVAASTTRPSRPPSAHATTPRTCAPPGAGWASRCPPAPSSSARYELVLQLSPKTGIVLAGPGRCRGLRADARARRHLADGAGAAQRDALAGAVHRRVLRRRHLRAALPRRPARPQPADGGAVPRGRGDRVGRRAPGTRATTNCTCPATGWSSSAACCSRAGWRCSRRWRSSSCRGGSCRWP